MKLTQAQIITLRAAVECYEEKAQNRAEIFTGGTFWQEEAESAAALSDLFKDALKVEVESVQLEPAKDACGDIGCDGQCEVTVAEIPQRQPIAPALLNAIDECADSKAARDVLRNAEPAERRAVAKHLGIPVNDLLDVITRRLRPALKAAA